MPHQGAYLAGLEDQQGAQDVQSGLGLQCGAVQSGGAQWAAWVTGGMGGIQRARWGALPALLLITCY